MRMAFEGLIAGAIALFVAYIHFGNIDWALKDFRKQLFFGRAGAVNTQQQCVLVRHVQIFLCAIEGGLKNIDSKGIFELPIKPNQRQVMGIRRFKGFKQIGCF